MMGYGKLLRRGGGCYYDIQKVSTTKSNFTQREGGRERERERERERSLETSLWRRIWRSSCGGVLP